MSAARPPRTLPAALPAGDLPALPAIAPDLVEQALRQAEAGRVVGEWDHWFTVQLDRKTSVRLDVRPKGLRVRRYEQTLVTRGRSVVPTLTASAESYLTPETDAWRRAVVILESAPELARGFDTRGD
jgi:hypothetical protein